MIKRYNIYYYERGALEYRHRIEVNAENREEARRMALRRRPSLGGKVVVELSR